MLLLFTTLISEEISDTLEEVEKNLYFFCNNSFSSNTIFQMNILVIRNRKNIHVPHLRCIVAFSNLHIEIMIVYAQK